MADLPRVLVTAALGRVITPAITAAFPTAVVEVATNDAELRHACEHRVRFDAVLTDLTWNEATYEYCYDGLDVLASLRKLDRIAPVVVAAHGHGRELDHLEEAIVQAEVVGVVQKALGPGPVINALKLAMLGRKLPKNEFPVPIGSRPSIYSYFKAGSRGSTAARMAGAIAAGRASDSESLEKATNIPLNTVNKLTSYLGPLIKQRKEHCQGLHLTGQVVYRWVGEHKHYILSWCRRHGHGDVATPRDPTS